MAKFLPPAEWITLRSKNNSANRFRTINILAMDKNSLIIKFGNPKNWTNTNLYFKATQKNNYPEEFLRLIEEEVNNRGGIDVIKIEYEKEELQKKEELNKYKHKKRNRIRISIISSFLIFSLSFFIILSATKEKREFQNAIESKSIIEIQNFLEEYPGSKYKNDAETEIIEIEYLNANKENNKTSIENFLKKYPNSKFTAEAVQTILELEIKEVKRLNSIPAYEGLLKKYPNNPKLEEISFLLACKRNNLEGFHLFLCNYPNCINKNEIFKRIQNLEPKIQTAKDYAAQNPGKDYYSYVIREINNILFLKYSPTVIKFLKKNDYSNEELIKSIDKLCKYPPSSITEYTFRQYQQAINKYQKFIEKDKTLMNPIFYYSFSELMYHVSNAIGKSYLSIMLESMAERLESGNFNKGLTTIDIFKVTEAAQVLIDYLLLFILNDNDIETRYRGILAIDRITRNNSIPLSKRWTKGEEVKGLEIIHASIPINLESVISTLKKIEKIETNSENKKLIQKIISRIS